jgi:outer membrane protein
MKTWIYTLFIAAALPALAQNRMDLIFDVEGVHRQNDIALPSNVSGTRFVPEFRNGGGVGGGINWFFTDRVSLEAKAAGLISKTIVRVVGSDFIAVAELGNAQIYPLSAILQWHLLERGAVRPYVGAGATYTILKNINRQIGPSSATGIRFKDATGLTVDGGLELHASKRWSLYGDVRYVPVESQATATFPGTTTKIDLKVLPLIVSFGLAWHR